METAVAFAADFCGLQVSYITVSYKTMELTINLTLTANQMKFGAAAVSADIAVAIAVDFRGHIVGITIFSRTEPRRGL